MNLIVDILVILMLAIFGIFIFDALKRKEIFLGHFTSVSFKKKEWPVVYWIMLMIYAFYSLALIYYFFIR